MHWLNIFALSALSIGLLTGLDSMNALRSREHPQAEITWWQKSLALWRYETLSMVAITIHGLGLMGLAAVILRYLLHSEVTQFPPGASPREFFLLALVAIFYTAWKTGIAIAFQLAQLLPRHISYGISNEGLWYGGSLLRWQVFDHYEIGPGDGQISLYSSYSPHLRTWVLQPSPKFLVRVVELIQKNLARPSAMGEAIPLQRSPFALILGITILVLGALLPAIWGLMQNLSWTWMYALVAFLLAGIFGNRLMTVFDGRGKYPEQEVQTT
jgi:hypothetical protein